jgi:hypothetical protein
VREREETTRRVKEGEREREREWSEIKSEID